MDYSLFKLVWAIAFILVFIALPLWLVWRHRGSKGGSE